MQAFFCDEQLLHDPPQYMRLGRICKPTDLPTRAQAFAMWPTGPAASLSAQRT